MKDEKMKWLIDIAIEAMKQYLIDNPRFVNRGDPAFPDYTMAAFTRDGAWHEIGLPGVVPAEAVAVLFSYNLVASIGYLQSFLRRHGNMNTEAASPILLMEPDENVAGTVVVPCDEEQKIDYYFQSGPWTGITLTVIGWWL